MAGTLTESLTPVAAPNKVERIVLTWTSSSGGVVSGNSTGMVNGVIGKVEFVPDSGGTAPTDLYDVTITNAAGIDILAGQGANLSGTVPSHVSPGVPLKDGTTTSVVPNMHVGTLTLNVTNAGNVKGGQVILYVR